MHTDFNLNASGVGLYISNSIKYEFIGLNLPEISGCENFFVKLKHTLKNCHLTISVIYRYPQNELMHFPNKSYYKLGELTKDPFDISPMGDFNVILDPKKSMPMVKQYVNILFSNEMVSCITKPTSVTDHPKTIIDHFITKHKQSTNKIRRSSVA